MPFLLLLCLSLACMPLTWSPPLEWVGLEGLRPIHSLSGTLVVIGAMLLAATHISGKTVRGLADPDERGRWLHYYGVWRTRYALATMAAFVLILYVCGWGWAVQTTLRGWLDDRPVPPGGELLILAPLPVMLLLSWICFYDVERALLESDCAEPPFGGRLGYVSFQIRQNLALIAAPVLVLIGTQGFIRQFPATFHDDRLQLLLIAPIAATVVVLMPWLIRAVLNLRPLPDGELRDRLEAAARRLNCRCSEILVWNTRLGVANAMVVGVTPWLRYILLSDRLLQQMTSDEVEAVFGHEAGHVRHRHMAFYLAFLTGSVAALSKATSLLDSVVEQHWPNTLAQLEAAWLALPSLAFLAAYIFGVFGFLSRRCERQADVFGCRAVSCTQPDCAGHDARTDLAPAGNNLCPTGIMTFCRALDKVAALNGISRSRPGWLHSWQHSTIAKRINFLHDVLNDPTLEPRFQRRVFWTKTALLAATAATLIVLWIWL